MDNIIDVSIPVAEVVDKHPEVLEILVELGFKPLANQSCAIQLVGKYLLNKVLSLKELLWKRLCVRLKRMVMK